MFHCIACNASFDSRSGLGNHKWHWGCSDNINSNVAIETNPNSNHTLLLTITLLIMMIELAKEVEIMQKMR